MAKAAQARNANATDRPPSAEALLDATAALLSEVTTLDVSLSEISQRSGVNSAMIKYHFGNKEGLLVALLERDAHSTMDALRQLVAMDWTAKRKLTVHIHGIVNAYFRSPYLNRLIHYLVESGSPGSSQRVTEVFIEPMIDAYSAIIEQGVREGSLRPTDPGMLYYALVGAADHIFHAGYSVSALMGVERIDEDLKRQYADFVVGIYLRGLAPAD